MIGAIYPTCGAGALTPGGSACPCYERGIGWDGQDIEMACRSLFILYASWMSETYLLSKADPGRKIMRSTGYINTVQKAMPSQIMQCNDENL